jgi:hypothetical protein
VNWDAAGAIGEVVGAAAVLVTLVYLATQIKQANNLSRFDTLKEIMNQFNHLNEMVVADPVLRQLLMKTGELSDDEREQLYVFAIMFCNVWVTIQIAYDNDQIDEEVYAAGAKDVRVEADRWPNFRPAVEQWLLNYPEHAEREIFNYVVGIKD